MGFNSAFKGLRYRRRHAGIHDVRSFRAVDFIPIITWWI